MTDDPKNKAQSDPIIIEGLEKSYLSIPHPRPREDPLIAEGTAMPLPTTAELPKDPDIT